MLRSRSMRLGLAVLLVVLSFSILGSAEPRFGGTLTIGTLSDPDTLNVLQSNSVTGSWIQNLLYPSLLVMNEDGEKIGYIATDWGYSDDGLTAWYELRDDVYWQNGEPLTSEDVKFTAEVTKDHQIGFNASLLADVVSISTPTPTRIVFELEDTYGPFLTSLGFWLRLVPKSEWESVADPKTFANADPVGAGPFELVSYEDGQYYRLEAVDQWFDAPAGRPYLDEVVYRVYPDINTMVLALLRGDIDLAANPIPPASLDQVRQAADVNTASTASLGYYYMGFNMQNEDSKPLQDVTVRQAIATALNKEMMRNMVMRGQAIDVAVAVSPVLGDWHNPDVTSYEYDPEAARQMLADAGYVDTTGDGILNAPDGEPLRFRLLYDGGHAVLPRVMRIVDEDLQQVGIAVDHVAVERNTYLATFRSQDYDIMAGGWGIMDEPADYLYLLYHSDTFGPDGINRGGVNNPELDVLIDKARGALDHDDAVAYVHAIQEKLIELMPDIPLFTETYTFGYRNTFANYGVYPSDLRGMVDPQSLARVYKTE